MQFTPLLISPLIYEPLRYFFSTYGGNKDLVWNSDEKLRTMEIGDMHDYFKIPFGERPRVLVDRGGYQISKVGLGDNLMSGKSMAETSGLNDGIYMQLYQGTANIIIEARHKGTCEIVSDMVSHFISWSRPLICDTQGFKDFGSNMAISSCSPAGQEDDPGDPKFQITIQLPWVKEEQWRIRNDGVTLKNVLLNIGRN